MRVHARARAWGFHPLNYFEKIAVHVLLHRPTRRISERCLTTCQMYERFFKPHRRFIWADLALERSSDHRDDWSIAGDWGDLALSTANCEWWIERSIFRTFSLYRNFPPPHAAKSREYLKSEQATFDALAILIANNKCRVALSAFRLRARNIAQHRALLRPGSSILMDKLVDTLFPEM